jgi:parallel beta helix pectate lyase-like protein
MRSWVPAVVSLCLTVTPAGATVWHVDPMGSDTFPGSLTQPVQTLAAAVSRATAGDVVVVRAGVYREAVAIGGSGAPGAPIILRGLPGAVLESPDASQSLSAFDVRPGVAYVTIQGFELRAGFAETVFVRPGAHHIELAGLVIHGNHTGVWIAGATDVVVRDCDIHANYRTGLRIFAGAQRISVVDTLTADNDDGLGCSGDSDGLNADASTADIVLERVRAVGNSEDGFDLQTPTVAVFQAVAHDNGCSGFKVAGGDLENVDVERQNVGININGQPGATVAVRSATIVDNSTGVRATGGGYDLALFNSVIAGPGKALTYGSSVNLTERYSVMHRPASKDRLIERVDSAGDVRYSGDDINSGRWQRDSGQGVATISADPALVPGSCEPQAVSPVIDSGETATAPPLDLEGRPRPIGASADRGAVEWAPSGADIRVRRAIGRMDGVGSGRLSMRLDVGLPPTARLDPTADAVAVSVRGSRGLIARAIALACTWGSPPSNGTSCTRRRSALPLDGAPRMRVFNMRGRLQLWFDARDANLWAAADGTVEVGFAAGGLRGTTIAAVHMAP